MNAHTPFNGVRIHTDLIQGSEEWHAARCGLLTASEMKLVVKLDGGYSITRYRPSGHTPEKLTAKRKAALDAIGQREGTIRELATIANASDGIIRGLIDSRALESFVGMVPLSLKSWNDGRDLTHLYELLAQRITGYVEPHYISDDMLRGQDDEIEARGLYTKHFAPVDEAGFITNGKWGFTLGYSPDGLVGVAGLIECKSRRQKYQVQTIIENVAGEGIPADYVMQCQTGLLVSEREWIDLVSYSGGMPLAVMRVHPDAEIQDAILDAAAKFEARLAERLVIYRDAVEGMIPTERRVIQEMFV